MVEHNIQQYDTFVNTIYLYYIKEPQIRLIEIFVVLLMFWYFIRRLYRKEENELFLSDADIKSRIDAWEPEKLIDDLTDLEKFELNHQSINLCSIKLKTKVLLILN